MEKELEENYQAFCKEYNDFFEATTNQKINYQAVEKLVTTVIEKMTDSNNSDYVFPSKKALFESAGVDESTFARNIKDLNGLDLAIKKLLIDELDNHLVWVGVKVREDGKDTDQNHYDRGVEKVFEALSKQELQLSLKYAIRRFGIDFWSIALRKMYPYIVAKQIDHDDKAKSAIYDRYLRIFVQHLSYWEAQNFSSEYIAIYKKELNPLVALKNEQVDALEEISHLPEAKE